MTFRLDRLRVLIVEDETLIAVMIEDALLALGCEIVGPTGKLDVALQLAKEESLGAAILDITIRGGKVYPVADVLLARGIPFVLASGYSDWALPGNLRALPRLSKPFTTDEVEAQMQMLAGPLS